MKNFAVVQHTFAEFLGLIETQLEKRDIGFSYMRPFVGGDVPGNAGQFDALFLLGGKDPVTDRDASPWLEDELRLVGLFRQARRPIVGFGFGAMVIAEYEGAQMSAEPFHQAYWTTAHITPAGKGDAVAEAANGRRVLVMTNGSAKLPSGLEPILVDDQGNWIAIRPERLTYGLLFRPELKPGMIEDMIMEEGRQTPDNIGELLEQTRLEWQGMQELTDLMVVALVTELDLMTERRKAPVFRLNVVQE